MKGFDCCSLTLQPTTNPVVTPHGWIFDKEAIITFILDKKKEYNKKLKKYEEQLEAEKQEFRDSTNREEEEARARFEATEKNIVTKRVDAFRKESDYNSVSNTATDSKKRHLPAFWMPSMGPQVTIITNICSCSRIILLCHRLRRLSLPNLTKWSTARYPGKG